MALSHVVIFNDASRARGGATGLAVLSALQLRARGLRVSFVCGDAGDAPELRAAGVEVIAAGSGRLLDRGRGHAMRRGIYDPEMRDFAAGAVASTDGPGTVFHLHGWAQIFSPSVFAALAPVAAKTFIHAHDMFLACPNGVYMDYRRNQVCPRVPLSAACVLTHCDKRSYAHKLWRILRQRALFKAFDPELGWAGVLAIHPGMLPRLARAGYSEELLQVVRNPVAAFTPERVQAEKNSYLVYVGRLEEDKGALDLARAARRVGAELVCVGDGSLRAVMERDFPGIRITGWLSKPEMTGWVSGARALVMPSHHPEPFALVLAEAAGSGLPVAVADTALMAEEIVTAGLGLSFDVFDADDFDRTLTRLMRLDAAGLQEMSQRGFSGPVRLGQTEAAWVSQLVRLYQSALPGEAPQAARVTG
jgi:glycosyltransferase involved in cell wall biosynthesis